MCKKFCAKICYVIIFVIFTYSTQNCYVIIFVIFTYSKPLFICMLCTVLNVNTGAVVANSLFLLKRVSTWNKLLIDRLYHCAVGTEQEAATELLRNKPNSSVAAVLGQEPWSILVRLGNHSVKNHKQISETKKRRKFIQS